MSQYYIYIGMTNDLMRRVYEHRQKLVEGFTKKYNINMLVYCEITDNVEAAIARERHHKGWRRSKKVALIESFNPHLEGLGGRMV